jgi:hypothetical protein
MKKQAALVLLACGSLALSAQEEKAPGLLNENIGQESCAAPPCAQGKEIARIAESDKKRKQSAAPLQHGIPADLMDNAGGLTPGDLNTLGTALYSQARYHEAELLWRKALAAWDRAESRVLLDRAIIEGNLGAVLRTEGRYADAETLLLDSLRQVESLTGSGSAETAHAASNLAALYLVWGAWPKAESYALRAEATFAQVPQASTRERRDNQRLLASIYVRQARYGEAKALLGQLVQREDRLTAGAYNDLAVVALEQHRPAEAESWARRALEVAGRTLPTSSPDRAAILNNLAQSCRFQANYQEAEKDYREAIAIWTAALGPGHLAVARGYFGLAGLYHDRGREAGAEELYRRAIAIFESTLGQSDPTTLVARDELAEVLRAQARYTESDKLSQPTLAALEQALGPEDARVVRALGHRVRLLESAGRMREAALLRNRIQETAKRTTSAPDGETSAATVF